MRLGVAPYVAAQVGARCRTPALKSGVVFGSARRVGEATEDSPLQLFSSKPDGLEQLERVSLLQLTCQERGGGGGGEARPVCHFQFVPEP